MYAEHKRVQQIFISAITLTVVIRCCFRLLEMRVVSIGYLVSVYFGCTFLKLWYSMYANVLIYTLFYNEKLLDPVESVTYIFI